MIQTSMELQLMMTPDASDSKCHSLHATQTAKESSEKTRLLNVSVGQYASIRTPQDVIHTLRNLSREARVLTEGLSSLIEIESLGQSTARRHLLLSQSALGHAAAVFETLASLLESD